MLRFHLDRVVLSRSGSKSLDAQLDVTADQRDGDVLRGECSQ